MLVCLFLSAKVSRDEPPGHPRPRRGQAQSEMDENTHTGAEFSLVAKAVEVVALAQLPPHFAEVAGVAHALAAHAVPAAAAHVRAAGRGAAVPLGRPVVALGALAARAQAPRVARADAALEGAVAVVTLGAVGLSLALALAVAFDGDGDGQRVLEADGLDDERLFFLLFGAGSRSRLHAERHLRQKRKDVTFQQRCAGCHFQRDLCYGKKKKGFGIARRCHKMAAKHNRAQYLEWKDKSQESTPNSGAYGPQSRQRRRGGGSTI